MKKLLSIVAIVLTLCFASFCLIACDGKPDNHKPGNQESGNQEPNNQVVYVDYSKDNSFEFELSEDADAVTYMPVGATPKYGLLFYVGTSIAPKKYAYFAEPLAKQGFAVVIPKVPFAYKQYKETEPAFEKYPNVEFFIAGHSQGGGAAVRRAQENIDSVKGVILCAPLCFGQDTIKDSSVPTLLLEASKDGVLTPTMKADAKTRLPDSRTEYMLEGCHMSFSSYDSNAVLKFFKDGPATDEEKAAQKEMTYNYILSFMRAAI